MTRLTAGGCWEVNTIPDVVNATVNATLIPSIPCIMASHVSYCLPQGANVVLETSGIWQTSCFNSLQSFIFLIVTTPSFPTSEGMYVVTSALQMKTLCQVLCSIYYFKWGSSSLSRPLKSKRNPILITFSNIFSVLKPLLYMEFLQTCSLQQVPRKRWCYYSHTDRYLNYTFICYRPAQRDLTKNNSKN